MGPQKAPGEREGRRSSAPHHTERELSLSILYGISPFLRGIKGVQDSTLLDVTVRTDTVSPKTTKRSKKA